MLTFYGEKHHADLPQLLSRHHTGQVHSIFQNGFNLKMGSRLIFIGNTKNGSLPFGIHLQPAALQQLIPLVDQNWTAVWKEQSLFLSDQDNRLEINLSRSTAFHHSITKLDPEKSFPMLEVFAERLMEHGEPVGIGGLYVDQFLGWYLAGEEEQQDELFRYVRDLMEAVSSNSEPFIDRTLRYFLGRGDGLTPSGDDMLTGLLAVHAATGICSTTFMTVLKKLVETEFLTTEVSSEYLVYALEGKFSSAVADLLHALIDENDAVLDRQFDTLMQVGHSSGVDAAFGLLTGMLATRRKTND